MTGGAGRLAGRVALVTGSSRGIGLAVVERLRADGAIVVGFDLPGTGVDIAGDVSVTADWAAAVATCETRHGRLDILVNNAGIAGTIGPMATYADDVFDRVMAVNARGVFLGMRAAVPLLSRAGGAIVNIASISGLGGGRNTFAYNASKHAVIGMTQVAALELAAAGIRVNAVCPAPTATEMMFALERSQRPDDPAAFRAGFSAMIPLGRYGEPAEIAAAVAFLASDEAAFVTGTALPVDGGMRAR